MGKQRPEEPTLCEGSKAFVEVIMQVKQTSFSLEPWPHNFF